MAWTVGKVQQTQVKKYPVMPGFNLQQDGRSPAVTFVFENEEKAEAARELMERVVDSCAAIFPANT